MSSPQTKQKPVASLSLDLDNKWSYMKTHGDPEWEEFPSYFDFVIPHFLKILHDQDLKITVFVVGQDAALKKNEDSLRLIAEDGHEIGNHSFHHEPWLHRYSDDRLQGELERAEDRIMRATGEHPVGFRGPGFSYSESLLRILARRGYEYDASTFPTFLGPLARAYYFLNAKLTRDQKEDRELLFGKFSEGFKPLKPYLWEFEEDSLLEIPVTTMPLFKVPIHASYLLYLAQRSRFVAKMYWRFSIMMCRLFRVAPSLLLHPLDFLGGDEEPDLSFFPAMGMPGEKKRAFMSEILESFRKQYDVLTLHDFTQRVHPHKQKHHESAQEIPQLMNSGV